MNRIHLAPLALSLGMASAGSAFAQAGTQAPADFGPPPPAIAAQPQDDVAVRPPARFELPPPQEELTQSTQPESAAQFAPPASAVEEPPLVGDTRRAAPSPGAPRPSADAQTGPYLGHGLFNNSGPDDFGA